MAINFLNSVDFNKNELLNPTIENQPNDTAAGTGAEGQLYFNTTDDILKVYAGGSWVEVGGGVTSLATTDGTYIDLTPNSATTGAVTVTADLSAVDGTAAAGERYLTKNNKWAEVSTIPGTYTFTTESNTGSATVASGDNLIISGGTYITGAVSKAGTNITNRLDHDSTSRNDTTSTDSPSYGGTFEAVTSVTTNATGHVTAIDVSTVTIPALTDNYVDSVSFSTGTGVLTLGRTGALVDLPVDLDGRYLELDGGTMTGDIDMDTNQITNLPDPTNAQDAATKAYVDAATVGGLIYQGGYNASTNTPDLTTSPNSIEKGWTYTVTADGTFFGEQLRVGDVLIAEQDDPSALADWTTVQNNIDLASLTQVGIGNVAAGTGISVSYSNGTATVTNTDTNTSNTASGQITAGSTSGTVTHNFGSNKVMVQTYLDNATDNYPVVYCDITRTANSVTATIATSETDDIIILVQKIG